MDDVNLIINLGHMKSSECTKNSMHVKRKDEFHGDYRLKGQRRTKTFCRGITHQ